MTDLFVQEILKQPLHTSVAIDTKEFEEFCVEEKLHVAFSVKDFKAIITHADSLNASITALYSRPTRPLQIAYESDNGMLCEFTLMTIGDFRGGSVTPAPSIARTKPNAPSDRQTPAPSNSLMPPPSQPVVRQRHNRPSPPPPKASLDPESLFFPEDESPSGWDDRDEKEEEDLLGWDGSEDNVSLTLS
jgi:cell cycle checkpoint control protein RAD9A